MINSLLLALLLLKGVLADVIFHDLPNPNCIVPSPALLWKSTGSLLEYPRPSDYTISPFSNLDLIRSIESGRGESSVLVVVNAKV